jgi:hypothetical protein
VVLRGDHRKLVDAVTSLLVENADLLSGTGNVAVLRGFDRASRATRDAITAVVREHGGSVLDLAPAPRSGEIAALPAADLVVAVSSSTTAAAERCAAFWGVPVVSVTDDAGQRDALVITSEEGLNDVLVRELRFTGDLRWAAGDAELAAAVTVLVRPTAEGALVAADAEEPVTSGEVVIVAGEDVVGEMDGAPRAIAPGRYRLTAAAPVRRILVTP